MAFTFSNGWEKIKRRIILYDGNYIKFEFQYLFIKFSWNAATFTSLCVL